MKLFFDFFPIIIFFVTYKYFGIYYATATAMLCSIMQVAFFWFKHRRCEIMHIITLFSILILGTATLLSHNEMFIKWKPTALYWCFAILFIGSQLFGEKTLIQRLMDEKVTLPQKTWSQLNLSWVLFFCLMGCVNLYVAYHFNTNTWVNFKLFGILGSTIVFGVLQALYIARNVPNQE
jgi:intracellular septation protein